MIIDQILIHASPGETRTALLSEGRLVEILMDRAGGSSLVGNIYRGRVGAIAQGLDAAFISIGSTRDGFLALPEARPGGETGGRIGDYVNEGDAVLVQVQRDPVEDKGAKLTTHIHLAGAYLIFRPFQAGVSVSRRIVDQAERQRLTGLAAGFAPENGGFIVRTQAEGADDAAIDEDAVRLADRWRDIAGEADAASPPTRVFAEAEAACRALRDFGGEALREVLIDGADALNRVRGFCEDQLPWLAPLVTSHKGTGDLFEDYGVQEQIDAAYAPMVGLAGGGSLIISQTPALTAIDVNTGGAGGDARGQAAFDVNLRAAAEAARQIRLRNISGLIVVDFVPLRDDSRKKDILEALREAAAADPLGLNIVGFTRLGLVEMTRPRHGLSLRDVVCGPGPAEMEKSAETLALEALRRVLSEVRGGGTGVTLRAEPKVIAVLEGDGGAEAAAALALKQAQDRLGLAIGLEADQTLADGQFDIIIGGGDRNGDGT